MATKTANRMQDHIDALEFVISTNYTVQWCYEMGDPAHERFIEDIPVSATVLEWIKGYHDAGLFVWYVLAMRGDKDFSHTSYIQMKKRNARAYMSIAEAFGDAILYDDDVDLEDNLYVFLSSKCEALMLNELEERFDVAAGTGPGRNVIIIADKIKVES